MGLPPLSTGDAADFSETLSWEVPPCKQHAFDPGDLVAERYQIVRFIARGSGGEIYEALDGQLGLHVALKNVIPESAGDPRAQKRFLREILLARKVTHPNVCRIFDLGWHKPAGSGAELLFLTMELVQGETLAERIERAGVFSPAAALPVVRQMASALAAAHAVGVVHRDFKSSNVLLVDETGPRAVVADFGLARHLEGAEAVSTVLTREGTILGTPAYMAPEQVLGKPATPAVDVYALGVVLYEMVTGRLPFAGGRPIDVASRRLSEDPPSPRSWRPDLEALWEETILRCLARDPADRFTTPLEVVAMLEGSEPVATPRQRRSRRLILLGLGGAMLACGLLAVGYRQGLFDPARAADPAALPISTGTPRPLELAFLGCRDLQGREAEIWIATTLQELFTYELAGAEGLEWMAGEEVEKVKTALDVETGETLTEPARQELADSLGADVFLSGSYLALGEGRDRRLSLYLRLERIGSEPVLWIEQGREDELPALVHRAAERVRRQLELAPSVAPAAQER